MEQMTSSPIQASIITLAHVLRINSVQKNQQFSILTASLSGWAYSVAVPSASSERLVNKKWRWLPAVWTAPNQKAINLVIYFNLFLNKQMAVPIETKQTCVVHCI